MEDLLSIALGTALILLPNLIIGYLAFVAKMEQ